MYGEYPCCVLFVDVKIILHREYPCCVLSVDVKIILHKHLAVNQGRCLGGNMSTPLDAHLSVANKIPQAI